MAQSPAPEPAPVSAPPEPCNSLAWWNEYFRESWGKRGGNQQTRIFARRFCRQTLLRPQRRFSLLDVSCALGDALPVFRRAWPRAALRARDFSAEAIGQAQERYPGLAEYSVGRMEDLADHHDVIYCCATLEHFDDYAEKARGLLAHCAHLCLIVPFREMHNGQPLRADPTQQHQATFDRASFDYLLTEGLASAIRTRVYYCRGAWSWTLRAHLKRAVLNLGRALCGRPRYVCPTMILFEICSATAPQSCAELGLHQPRPAGRT